jgi:hypothetical protein
MINFTSGMNGAMNKTYNDISTICADNGQKICSYKDLCKSVNNPLFTPQPTDSWAPISDSVNDWVQIGNKEWPVCIKHTDLYDQYKDSFDKSGIKRNPDWGTTPRNTNVMYSCCKKTCSDINCQSPQVCDPSTLKCSDPTKLPVDDPSQNDSLGIYLAIGGIISLIILMFIIFIIIIIKRRSMNQN